MLYFAAPIAISYLLFVFIAEQINPLKSFRENGKRRRAKQGRQVALAAIPVGYAVIFTLNFLSTTIG